MWVKVPLQIAGLMTLFTPSVVFADQTILNGAHSLKHVQTGT